MCTTFRTNRKLQFGCVLCTNLSSISALFWKWKSPVALLKPRRSKNRVRKQNNCPNIDNIIKSTSSRIPKEQAPFVLIYTYLILFVRVLSRSHYIIYTRTADYRLSIKHRLWYRTRTSHYGLNVKQGRRYKTRTADLMRPSYCSPCSLLTSRK